ncbi:MAG: ABC transporter, partial [Bacteroidales bacterium]|nr:ABC transporter [Bacteroidales bacterium]
FLVCDISDGAGNISGTFPYLKSVGFKVTSPGTMPLGQFSDKGFQFLPVFSTPDSCWIETTTTNFIDDVPLFESEKGDEAWNGQPLMVGAVRTVGDKVQKCVVLSNADCISNSELGMNRKDIRSANFYLVMETARWFTGGRYPVNVSRQGTKDNDIRGSYDQLVWYKGVFMWLIPLLLAMLGTVICVRRYRQ